MEGIKDRRDGEKKERLLKIISETVFLRKLAITNLKILTYTHYSVYDSYYYNFTSGRLCKRAPLDCNTDHEKYVYICFTIKDLITKFLNSSNFGASA